MYFLAIVSCRTGWYKVVVVTKECGLGQASAHYTCMTWSWTFSVETNRCSRISILGGNFRFRACKDGKRFDNFLINLSSFEILIVLSAPDGTYGCNCYLSCPVSSKLGQTLYVFGAELGFKNLLISGQ